MSATEIMRLIVVYKNPNDFQSEYVAREQRTMSDGSIQIANDIFAVATCIVETWL